MNQFFTKEASCCTSIHFFFFLPNLTSKSYSPSDKNPLARLTSAVSRSQWSPRGEQNSGWAPPLVCFVEQDGLRMCVPKLSGDSDPGHQL